MVIWIIGKSGSGKTYLAKFLKKKIRYKNIKWIDRDKFRLKYSRDLGYSKEDREKNSERISKLCKKYENKNYLVICSILSIFRTHQKKNRDLYKKYFQIYIKCDSKKLALRNNKKIYSKKKYVVGKDISFPEPFKSDFIITNTFKPIFLIKAEKIIKKINEKI